MDGTSSSEKGRNAIDTAKHALAQGHIERSKARSARLQNASPELINHQAITDATDRNVGAAATIKREGNDHANLLRQATEAYKHKISTGNVREALRKLEEGAGQFSSAKTESLIPMTDSTVDSSSSTTTQDFSGDHIREAKHELGFDVSGKRLLHTPEKADSEFVPTTKEREDALKTLAENRQNWFARKFFSVGEKGPLNWLMQKLSPAEDVRVAVENKVNDAGTTVASAIDRATDITRPEGLASKIFDPKEGRIDNFRRTMFSLEDFRGKVETKIGSLFGRKQSPPKAA